MRLRVDLLLSSILLGCLPALAFQADTSPAPSKPLTLVTALEIALRENPELAALDQERKARVAEVLQAKLPSNPEIAVEVENLYGKGEYGRGQEVEITSQVRQALEFGTLGGRIRLAKAEKELAQSQLDAKRFDVLSEVGKAFVETLAAQERVKQLRSILAMASQMKEAAAQRVMAGKSSPLDTLRAKASMSLTQSELERSESEQRITLKNLAKVCGRSSFDSLTVEGDLEKVAFVPTWEKVAERLAENPDLIRWSRERNRQEAALSLEKAARIPPLSVGAGFRQSPEQEGHAFTAEVSLPLPVWNWNQGAVRAGRHRVERTVKEARAAGLDLESRLFEAFNRLASSRKEIDLMRKDVLPSVEGALAAAEEGYRAGKYGSLEVLDARRTWSEARGQYLETLTRYHVSALELDRLTARRPGNLLSNP
jgi:cobalt-zinc-cadmium efflux system outer membrane protein